MVLLECRGSDGDHTGQSKILVPESDTKFKDKYSYLPFSNPYKIDCS